MLISDSMSLLWMIYIALSLVVLLAGYLGLAFLPRLPRLALTWAVAGVMWMPAGFELPLVEEGQVYVGKAPAVMVVAVAWFEHGPYVSVAILVAVGAAIGALFGLLLWWLGRQRAQRKAEAVRGQAKHGRVGGRNDPAGDDDDQRREPVLS